MRQEETQNRTLRRTYIYKRRQRSACRNSWRKQEATKECEVLEESRKSRGVGEIGGGEDGKAVMYQKHGKLSIGYVVMIQQLVGTAMHLLT